VEGRVGGDDRELGGVIHSGEGGVEKTEEKYGDGVVGLMVSPPFFSPTVRLCSDERHPALYALHASQKAPGPTEASRRGNPYAPGSVEQFQSMFLKSTTIHDFSRRVTVKLYTSRIVTGA
jgi:hypothetical protein